MASPARQALKSNLDADDDSPLTLSKKKSWFGSLRNVMSKGALQAKAAVDGFRADEQKTGQYVYLSHNKTDDADTLCRKLE